MSEISYMAMTFNMLKNHLVLKLVLLIAALIITHSGAALVQNDTGQCTVRRCSTGPTIRFPFHFKNEGKDEEVQPHDSCVFPGIQLSCDTSDPCSCAPGFEFKYQVNIPRLHLSLSVKAETISIDYKLRQLHFSMTDQITGKYESSSATGAAASTSSSFKPFTSTPSQYHISFHTNSKTDISLYKCSPGLKLGHRGRIIYSLSSHDSEFYAFDSHYKISQILPTSCTKLYNISNVPSADGSLIWSGPDCEECEVKRQYCKFKPNSTSITQCFPIPKGPTYELRVAGEVGGIIFLSLIVAALCNAIYSYGQNRNYQLKIETFLEDYKALKPTRYSYTDIKMISNHFKFKLGEGGYGSVFKGQLSTDVAVAVKVLNDTADSKGGGEDFVNEVSTIGLIHHINVVRLVGYCADGCRRALVYEFLPNNSLEKFVYSRENQDSCFLGWEKVQCIALGIAKGIEYLHQGCAQRIIHFDIKPHNILLDQNYNPKISDFGLAKLCNKGQSTFSLTKARGTIGYIAPEVFSRNFGKVSSKSDVYSFGMLLLEMVGAKDNTSAGAENRSEVYFPEWIFHELEQGKEMRSEIEEQGDSNIARKLTVVGLWCINWHPADRPTMKHVIQMIQAEDCPALPPNPFSSTNSSNVSAKALLRPFTNELEVISESE